MPKFLPIVVLGLLLGGFVAYRAQSQKKTPASPPQPLRGPASEKVEDVIGFLSNEAVTSAREDFGKELDYSIQSIRTVDEILEQLHQQVRNNPNAGGVNGLASMYGAYIGECIRRSESGAHWEQDHRAAGVKSYPLHWKDGEAFPMAWCLKRIKFGAEDMLWFKYAALKEKQAGGAQAETAPKDEDRP